MTSRENPDSKGPHTVHGMSVTFSTELGNPTGTRQQRLADQSDYIVFGGIISNQARTNAWGTYPCSGFLFLPTRAQEVLEVTDVSLAHMRVESLARSPFTRSNVSEILNPALTLFRYYHH